MSTNRNVIASVGVMILLLLGQQASYSLGIPQTRTERKCDTLVICPLAFRAALQPWVEYRSVQGHGIKVVAPPATAYELRLRIRDEAVSGTLKNVLIVGDAGSKSSEVVTEFRMAKVNKLFGSEPEIATDNPFADMDGDQIPDLTLGRLPVKSPVELSKMIDRIVAYESNSDFSSWRRRINVVAGVGGFDPITDTLIEQTTSKLIGEHIPNGYEFSMTYGSWRSPYCPAPERFAETAVNKFNEGCLFWIYAGHGSRNELDSIFTPIGRYQILDKQSVRQLNAKTGSPIALMLCCYCGAYDDPSGCLAETMLQQQNGPVAVICGTRVTMPYAMSQMSLEMMCEYFEGDAQTLGQLMLTAKRRMLQPDSNQASFAMRNELEQMGQALSPTPDLLNEELQEHVLLYHLLGDPLLRLPRPKDLAFEALFDDEQRNVQVTGTAPQDGELVVEICYSIDRFQNRPIFRKESDLKSDRNDKFQEDYQKHQNRVCTCKTYDVMAGDFDFSIDVPPESHGDVVVRAFLRHESGCAVASKDMFVPQVLQR